MECGSLKSALSGFDETKMPSRWEPEQWHVIGLTVSPQMEGSKQQKGNTGNHRLNSCSPCLQAASSHMQHMPLLLGSSAALKMQCVQSSEVLSNMLTNACVHWRGDEG